MNVTATAKQLMNGIVKTLNPPKKPPVAVPKNYLSETPEEYAERLMYRKRQKH